jgi:NADH-quinone oxidoreductase subunit J
MLEIFSILILIILSIFICCNYNPMYSIFNFIGLILFLSVYLIKHEVEFIAIALLIIYIGAIMVLFIFVIFLLNLTHINSLKPVFPGISKNTVYISLISGLFLLKLFFIFNYLMLDFLNFFSYGPYDTFIQYLEILYSTFPVKLNLFVINDINIIGYLLFTSYKVYLLMCGTMLLCAMVGSVLLVREK